MINKIIDYIEKNRVSTTEIADALGKKGKFSSLNSLNKNIHLVGKIKTIFASDESNYYVHKEIVEVQKNDVVQIFTHNCKDRAIIGDLISVPSTFSLFFKSFESFKISILLPTVELFLATLIFISFS